MNNYLYRLIRRNNIQYLSRIQEDISKTIYEFKLNRNNHEETIKYKTRKTINSRIYDKSLKPRKQNRFERLGR